MGNLISHNQFDLPLWQFKLLTQLGYTFAFVGNLIWICHLYNLVSKMMMLLFVLILLVSIGNLIWCSSNLICQFQLHFPFTLWQPDLDLPFLPNQFGI
jgi:hypothetical protein